MGKSLDLCSTFQLKKCSRRKQIKCSRRKRLPKDRLSSLPDDILLFILSFLTFKEVVNTSLLSRRWLNLWMYTLALHFHAPVRKAVVGNDLAINDEERRHYVKGVNRILRRHKGHYLKEFKIVCELDKHNQKDIDNWLEFALAKKVQCLDLNLLQSGCNPRNLRDNYVFPSWFLNFCSGKANSYGGKNQFLQFDFDLKCLKSLSLKSVDVTSEAISFFLLNCPFLERLEVVGNLKLVNLVISDPTLVLKYLTIKYCHKLKVLSISNFNLVSLDISAVEDLTLTGLPMLVELFITGASNKLTHSISQASSCFFQLEALVLMGYKLEDVTQLSNYDQLTKLKRLVIQVVVRDDESLITFISIINSCPHLEEFVLMLGWCSPPKRAGRNIRAVQRRRSPVKNKSLKVFEFVGYYGLVSDDELIMHVLANAIGLEKIVIDPRNTHLIDRLAYLTEPEKEARSNALRQYEAFRGSIPPYVHLLIR